MIEMTTARPSASLEPWRCEGHLRDGRPCNKLLMELDKNRPSYIRKQCERCSHVNIWVEPYRSAEAPVFRHGE